MPIHVDDDNAKNLSQSVSPPSRTYVTERYRQFTSYMEEAKLALFPCEISSLHND